MREVLGEGVDVACAVDEGVVHVTADFGARIRDERHAAAADRLGADEPVAFLEARQDEHVARPHEVGKVGAVPENLDARVREQFREPVPIRRHERHRRSGTCHSTDAGERSHASSARCRPLRTAATPAKSTVSPARCGTVHRRREEDRRIEAVGVAQQLLARKAFVEERLHDEVGRTEQIVRELVLLLLVAEDLGVVGVLVIGRQRDPEPLAFRGDDLVGESRVRVRTLEDRRDAEASGRLERPQRAERPDVHDVDCDPRSFGSSSRDDPVVKPRGCARGPRLDRAREGGRAQALSARASQR